MLTTPVKIPVELPVSVSDSTSGVLKELFKDTVVESGRDSLAFRSASLIVIYRASPATNVLAPADEVRNEVPNSPCLDALAVDVNEPQVSSAYVAVTSQIWRPSQTT